MSFPPGTEMFQFPGFASWAYGFSPRYPLRGGLPHSEISGSTPARGSPKLFAACHVLHRLLAPRHPPDALLILDPPAASAPHDAYDVAGTPPAPAPPPREGTRFWKVKATTRTYKLLDHRSTVTTTATDERDSHAYPCQTVRAQETERPRRRGHEPNLPAPVNDARERHGPKTRDSHARGRASSHHRTMSKEHALAHPARPRRARGRARGPRGSFRTGRPAPPSLTGEPGPKGHEHPAPPRPGGAGLVGLGRLERPTSRLSGVRSNQLSYRPESHPGSRPGHHRQDGGGTREDPSVVSKGRADGGPGPLAPPSRADRVRSAGRGPREAVTARGTNERHRTQASWGALERR